MHDLQPGLQALAEASQGLYALSAPQRPFITPPPRSSVQNTTLGPRHSGAFTLSMTESTLRTSPENPAL